MGIIAQQVKLGVIPAVISPHVSRTVHVDVRFLVQIRYHPTQGASEHGARLSDIDPRRSLTPLSWKNLCRKIESLAFGAVLMQDDRHSQLQTIVLHRRECQHADCRGDRPAVP